MFFNHRVDFFFLIAHAFLNLIARTMNFSSVFNGHALSLNFSHIILISYAKITKLVELSISRS